MSKYIGFSEEEKNKFISQEGTKVSSKLIFTSETEDNDVTLFDAVNIDWKGYKIGDTELSYSGDIISYITNSYSYILSNMVTSTDLPDFIGEDTKIRTQLSLYKTSNNQTSEASPFVDANNASSLTYFNNGSASNNYWALSKNNSHGDGEYVWMSSYYATFKLNNEFIGWEGPSSDPILLKGEKGDTGKPADYYEIRYGLFSISGPTSQEMPDIENPGDDDNNNKWYLVPQANNDVNLYTWSTHRHVVCVLNNNIIEQHYDGEWSEPIRMTGKNGVSQPIQPVLRYYWHTTNDYNNSPSCATTNENPNSNGVSWLESPGNPHDSYIYLWMIQGQRQNNVAHLIEGTSYWTSPICLSGADGEPGKDGDDLEFIYRIYEGPQNFNDLTLSEYDRPQTWDTNNDDYSNENYKGESENGYSQATIKWTDNPTGVSSTYKYEYCSYRRKTGPSGNKQWGKFSEPFPWSIYGENGLDGDGVEYIYYVTATADSGSEPTPPVFDLNPSSFQKSEVYGSWHDDPQQLNPNNNQLYQWVSKRNYKTITNNNKSLISSDFTGNSYEMGGYTVNVGDKIWFPYSNPELWNWYVYDGTNAPQIIMIYKRTGSITNYGNMPVADSNDSTSYTMPNMNGWTESPGNNAGDDTAYLWMTTNYYSSKKIENNKSIYHVTDDWQTPVCLTGESGKDGEDGADIEFIYLRTNEDNATLILPSTTDNNDYQTNDWPFAENTAYISSSIDGVGVIYSTSSNTYSFISGINAPMQQTSLDAVHDTWTDNPLGVTHEYDYEYCAIRKKINGTWETFCTPFLWSKWGEDGIDGDGVEYIFYLSPDENEVTFGDSSSQNPNNNPASWDPSPDPGYIHDDYKYPTHNPGWSDDPQGVSIHNKYEYVSIRHKRLNPTSNKMEWGEYSEPALWARYAEDGRAISLVLESNNDMTSISINSNHIVNNLVETDTTFSLYHNTSLVDLSNTSYYKMEIFDSNGDDYVAGWDAQNSYSYLKHNNDIIARLKPNSLNNNSYEMHISIPEGFNMTNIDDELRIYSKATILDPSFDINGDVQAGTEKLITTKVKGLQLSLDDIFQIWTDRAVLKNDGEGNYPILTYLQSLTSNTKITTAAEQNENKLFIIADNNNGYKDFINVGLNEFKNVENSYTFKLYYNESGESNISNPGTFLDEETVTLVTESEIYQLVVDPQVINFSNIGENDIINCNIIMYTGNIVTNITNSLNDHNLTIKYRLVPVTGTPGNYTVLSNGSSISVASLNINISETKGVEFALFKNNVLISSSTVVLTKNGADPILPLTCELLNDNWQIAVSKNKLSVLPGNRQTSFLSIYYGTTNIIDSISNLEITAIDAPTFWIEGQTITIETPPYDDNNVMIDFNVANAITLSSALDSQQNIILQLSFNYQQNHYYKYINLSYTALAQDGENAELYELFIEDDIVKQYVLNDLINYNPNSLSVKIRHVYGGTTEIINPQTISSTYKIYYTVDNSIWTITTTGSISMPNADFEKITIALFNETPNANYTNYIDVETVKAVRDGINGTDSFAEEFIYYCPEGNTEIDWDNISDTTLNPSTWERSTSPDYIENDAWQDHPTGIDEQHQYEYVAHRTWDKENEIWNDYTSPMIWSKWGHTGRDGDGVEYIYYRNNSEIFDGPDPGNWTNDEDFQTTEYVSSMNDDYYSYCNENFTISFSENSGFAYLFIPNGMRRYDNVITPAESKIYPNIINISYRESINGGDWSNWIDCDHDNDTCDNAVYEAHPDATSVTEAYYTAWVNTTDNCSIVKDKDYHNDPFKTDGVGIAVDVGSPDSPTTIYNTIYFKRWIYKYTNKPNLRLQIRCLFNDSANARFACGSLFGQHSFFMFNDNNRITLSGNIKSLFNVTSFSDTFTNEWPSNTPWHITRLFGNYNKSFTVTSLNYTINLSYNGNTKSLTKTRIPQPADNNTIYDTKNLVLSPKEIYQGDYSQLFHKCVNLVTGPIIAAKTINEHACENMFNSCDAITTIVMYVDTVQNTNAFNYFVPTDSSIPTGTIIHYGTYDFSSMPEDHTILRIRDWNIEKPSQWTDDPSGVSETNKYEWVSIRKYKEVTAEDTELTNAGLDVGDKAWHPYSEPTLWAKYGERGPQGSDGESAPRIVMLYKRTGSNGGQGYGITPEISNNVTNVGSNDWVESPRNAGEGTEYLWMTSNYYTARIVDGNINPVIKYTVTGEWSIPVCLTGEAGKEGVDGTDIEFIYLRTNQAEQYKPSAPQGTNGNNQVSDWPFGEYISENGILFVNGTYINNQSTSFENRTNDNLLYNVWTDNPLGVTSTYLYEYSAIRKKENSTWSQFGIPFLWSKYGENGVDGDGVEYIYYLSNDGNQSFSGNSLPSSWTSNPQYNINDFPFNTGGPASGTPPKYNGWTDDPSGVSASNQYEYVSVRTGREGNWGTFTAPKLWARYGKDGEASAVTIDNNNENIAVIINGHNVISSDNSVIEYSKIYMYDNLQKVNFSLIDVPQGFTADDRDIGPNVYHWDSSDKSYTVGFKFDPGQEIKNGRLSYTFTGRYINNGRIDRNTTIKIIGIHESDVPTLYQLRPTADIVKYNYTNRSYDPTTIYTYISYIENGENQIMKKYDTSRFGSGKLSLWANNTQLSNFTNGDNLAITTANFANNFPINLELKYNNILLDSESIPCVQDGQKGDTGAAAVTLDFTNDQINLAVDGTGKINVSSSQSKTTTLNIVSNDTYTIDSVSLVSNPDSNNISVSESMPISGFKKIHIRYTYTQNTNNVVFKITTQTSCRASIPENGYDIQFTFTIKKDGSLTTTSINKTFKICGQHTGENAVTYEIVPNVNSLKWNGTNYSTSQLSYTVYKYDGMNTPTVFSDFTSTTYGWWRYKNSSGVGNSGTNNPLNISSNGYKNMQEFYLDLVYDNKIIDTETISVVSNGERGIQGFTGPIIRYCGEWNNTSYYCGGKTNDNYDGVSPVYKDIVLYSGKYYTPYHTAWYYWNNETWASGAAGTGYINKGHLPSDTNYWEEATQFDFVATKLLYADQALINQISTHDLIATDSNGNPVAGVTSGKKMYGKGGSSEEIYSVLNSQSGSGWNHNIINSDENDPSNVRIFAGQIWNGNNSYSLTYAPFNVRQDGTTYMSKANIVGDVNIGGNVDISGTNVNVTGDIHAKSLSLQQSFYYNTLTTLPDINVNEHQVIYQMFYNFDTTPVIRPGVNDYLWLTKNVNSSGDQKTLYTTDNPGDSVEVDNDSLYVMYSASGINPNNSINQNFWLVTKTDLFAMPYNAGGFTTEYRTITPTFSVSSINSDGTISVLITFNAPSNPPTGGSLNSWEYTLSFNHQAWWRQKTIYNAQIDFDSSNPNNDDPLLIEINNYQYVSLSGSVVGSKTKCNVQLKRAKGWTYGSYGCPVKWQDNQWVDIGSVNAGSGNDTSQNRNTIKNALSCTGRAVYIVPK